MIVAECRIGHSSGIVNHNLLVKRGAQRLRDAAFDLAAALHRVDDAAGVRGVHAAQNLDHAGVLVDGNAKGLDVESDGTRRAGCLSVGGEAAASACAAASRSARLI
jgi:hypothetical protein